MPGVTVHEWSSAPARTRTTSVGAGSGHEHAPLQCHQQPDRQDPGRASLAAAVAIAHQTVEGCDLAGGIVIFDGAAAVTAASDPTAAQLDRLQHELGEGPGLMAAGTAQIVSSVDLGPDARWPAFGPSANGHGIVAVVSIPLMPAREVAGFSWWCGWLTLYSRDPGPFPTGSMALAKTLGHLCSTDVDNALHARSLEAALASTT